MGSNILVRPSGCSSGLDDIITSLEIVNNPSNIHSVTRDQRMYGVSATPSDDTLDHF